MKGSNKTKNDEDSIKDIFEKLSEAIETIGWSTDMMTGELLYKCSEKGICCPIHPDYAGLRRPRTKKTTKDGCLCWIAWGTVLAQKGKEND